MSELSNKFETYEEADDLRVLCPICGKHKRAVVGVYPTGVALPYYMLQRCTDEECTLHCQGHEEHIHLEDGTDYNDLVSSCQR